MAGLTISNLQATTIILNGVPITGFSDDSDAVSFSDDGDIIDKKQGADGKMWFGFTGKTGGDVMLKLAPNSDSLIFLNGLYQGIKTGNIVEVNGTIIYEGGSSCVMIQGIMSKAPNGFTQGAGVAANMEYTISFEKILFDIV